MYLYNFPSKTSVEQIYKWTHNLRLYYYSKQQKSVFHNLRQKKISIIHLCMPFRNLLSFTGMRNKHKWGFSRRRDNIAFHWRDTIELDLEGYSGFKTVEKLSRERENTVSKDHYVGRDQDPISTSKVLIVLLF